MANIIQDRAKAITAEDLIRRYNLDNLKTDRKNITNIYGTLVKQNTIIKEFVSNISTPTLENEPYNLFENKDKHIGNLYYDRESGKVYQFQKKENNYYWQELEDDNLLKSLALANGEADTSDNKRRIFYNQPIPPYELGDIWLDENTIMRCRCERSEGKFNSADWIIQEDYSNELYLKDTRAIIDQFKMTVEKDFVTKVQLETTTDSINASVSAITSEIITTATNKYEYYDEQISNININIGNISLEVSDVQTSLGKKITDLDSKIDIKVGEITQSITDNVNNLDSRITQTASSTKLSKDDFGSYAQQYYDRFLLGFNNSSKYIQIDTSGISIYSGSISNSYLLMQLNQYGTALYNGGTHIGDISTQRYASDNSQKGLVFDLDSYGSYMGWFQRSTNSGNYYAMLYYARAGKFGQTYEGIHFGTDAYGHGHNLSGFNMASTTANNYETVNNKSIDVITNIDVDEEGNMIVEKSSIGVRNGMITSVPNNAKEVQ